MKMTKRKKRRTFEVGAWQLRVKRSRTGLGLFAEEPIPARECIAEYVGRTLSQKEQYTSRSKYLFGIGRHTMLDGNVKKNIARYINHSCAPNCEVEIKRGRIFIFTKRRVTAGEELSYDYGTEYFDDHLKPRGCRCRKCHQGLV